MRVGSIVKVSILNTYTLPSPYSVTLYNALVYVKDREEQSQAPKTTIHHLFTTMAIFKSMKISFYKCIKFNPTSETQGSC